MGGFFGGGGASVDLASPPAIGNTTPNTGAFTTLSANNGTITASNPIFSASQTWNNAAVAFTSISISITNTASSSSSRILNLLVGASSVLDIDNQGSIRLNNASGNIKFSSPSSTRGIEWGTNSCLVSEADEIYYFRRGVSGSRRFGIFGDGVALDNGGSYSWTSGQASATRDLFLTRDAAQILAQRNSTNAQTFRLYNTFTDASNYERGFFRWNTNVLEIGAEAAGTGANRTVRISAYDAIDFRNTEYGYSVGSVSNGLWVLNNGPQITNVCRMEANYGFQLTSTKTLGWVSGTNMALAPDTALYRNAAGVLEVNSGTAGTFRDLIVRNFRMSAPTGVPTANNSTGTEGSIRWDADYIYICTAANTWKRVAIATW